MYDSAKYLIRADINASGVVERSDVVGAVFGQTEGLLGDDLDLRDLQESGKLGRIDVEIESEGGSSFGEITIASGLDKVQTAILAAALESIERVGPCRADVEISDIEDVRSAKRRQVVERATELLAEFDATALSSEDLVEEVRRNVRVEDITDFHGFPAGPRVAESDAIIVVEGRSDVLTLLQYGVKNAVAVEGTDVPEAVAELTGDRKVTAFLDGDRGGDLILKELAQVGDVDYVALAPAGRSVEDLSRSEVMSALRDKVPFEAVSDGETTAEVPATDGSTHPSPPGADGEATGGESPTEPGGIQTPSPGDDAATTPDHAETSPDGASTGETSTETPAGDPGDTSPTAGTSDEGAATDEKLDDGESEIGSDERDGASLEQDGPSPPETLAAHVDEVVRGSSGRARLLDAEYGVVSEGTADDAFDLLEGSDTVPATVVLDGELSQRILDVAAQRGVDRIVCRSEGEFVKQPANVRVLTADAV